MTKIVETDLLEHPAVLAWQQLKPSRLVPESIVVLQEMRFSSVFRLEGVEEGRGAVIAKRCKARFARVERTIYQDVLPRLPVTSLRFYGLVEAQHEPGEKPQCWIFLEDAGSEPYLERDPEHRILAGQWLGALHSFAASLNLGDCLPSRSAGYYLEEELQFARNTIQQGLSNPVLKAEDVAVLRDVLGQLDALELYWRRILLLCEQMPCTLVHGDLARKNARIRRNAGGKSLLIMDWESAGWGVPAVDLAQDVGHSLTPDLDAYLAVVQPCWPWLDQPELAEMAEVGKLLRVILAVSWASESLVTNWIEDAMQEMRLYRTWLAASLRAKEWENGLQIPG